MCLLSGSFARKPHLNRHFSLLRETVGRRLGKNSPWVEGVASPVEIRKGELFSRRTGKHDHLIENYESVHIFCSNAGIPIVQSGKKKSSECTIKRKGLLWFDIYASF